MARATSARHVAAGASANPRIATRRHRATRRGPVLARASASSAAPITAAFDATDRLAFAPDATVPRVVAPRGAPPVVILPGFGNDSNDYLAPFGDASSSACIATSLRSRGWDVHVVDLERRDWANILRAVGSVGFYTGESTTDPGYTWYLEKVDAAVRAALAANPGAETVDFVAHSAGGWLARAYVGGALNEVDWSKRRRRRTRGKKNGGGGGGGGGGGFLAGLLPKRDEMPRYARGREEEARANGEPSPSPSPPPEEEDDADADADADETRVVIERVPVPHPRVRRVVTLGSPHRAPPPGASDATRGAIGWVDARWPGARFAPAIQYTCVTGRTVRGRAGEAAKKTLPGYSCNSYAQVCGEGDGVEGDAVVPNAYATLPGARNITIDGVFHSMSKVGTYDESAAESWYGSDDVVDVWLDALVVD
jgi:hypothetical protein